MGLVLAAGVYYSLSPPVLFIQVQYYTVYCAVRKPKASSGEVLHNKNNPILLCPVQALHPAVTLLEARVL